MQCGFFHIYYLSSSHKFGLNLDRKPCSVRWAIVFNSIPTPYKQKTITRGCDGYIESFVCEIDRSQSRHMICWCGSGSGSPARYPNELFRNTHYIPGADSATVFCSYAGRPITGLPSAKKTDWSLWPYTGRNRHKTMRISPVIAQLLFISHLVLLFHSTYGTEQSRMVCVFSMSQL